MLFSYVLFCLYPLYIHDIRLCSEFIVAGRNKNVQLSQGQALTEPAYSSLIWADRVGWDPCLFIIFISTGQSHLNKLNSNKGKEEEVIK